MRKTIGKGYHCTYLFIIILFVLLHLSNKERK
jgi:hypothetical protein